MPTPFDPDSVTTNDHTTLSPEAELAQLRTRVAELEQNLTERKWKNDALEALAFGTAAATGREFLQALVRQLSLALNTQYAFVTEWVPGRTDRLRTVAGWSGNCAADPLEIDLHDSPCQQVMKDGTALFSQGIRQLFPRNTLLASINVESYMGVALHNSEGQPTGHLCVMGIHPFLFDESQGTAILNVFARRAAAELERLRAEETLRASEEQFRALVESATDAIVLANHEGRIISWNNASEQIFGYSVEEALGQPLTILMPPRYRQKHEQGLARMEHANLDSLVRKTRELVGVTKQGREFPLELSLACWRSRDGLFFSGIIRDISERTRAETALKASDQRYQFLYENNPSMYFTLAQEGTVLAVNHYGADQLGYSQEELTGHSILRVFDAHDHQTVLNQLNTCASNLAKLFHWEIQKTRKSGARLWVREHALAIKDETGTTVILVVCEDITAHKQVELRLKKINECFLRFGSDPLANINRLTALGGELLGGTCALYSRLEGALLRSIGQWQTPPGFNPVDQADGHLCADLIKRGDDHLCTVRNLANTSYVRTDPNVSRYQLHTYVGQIVTRGRDPIGSLCVVFQHDFVPTEADEGLMGILASAIETEEERMQVQEALRVSEERFEVAFRSSPYPVILTDLATGCCLDVNDASLKLFGYQREDVIGRTTLAVGLWPTPEARAAFFQLLEADGCVRNREVTLQSKNRTAIHMLVSSEVIELNGVRCLNTVGNDITQQRQTVIALRESEERFAKAFRSSPYPIIISEIDSGLCLDANDAALHLFGSSRDEVSGKIADQIGLWETPAHRRKFVQQLKETGAIRNIETTLRMKTGEIRHCVISAEQIEINGTDCMVTIGYDVTEQRRVEEALRTSEVQWRQFVADAPVGLVILDSHQRVLRANKVFCTLTGYSEREVVGNTYALYTHPEDLPGNLALTNAFFDGTRSGYTYEKRYIRKTGDIIWVAVTTTGIELPGHTGPLLLAVVENISERKRITEERERISQDLHDDILQSLYAVGMGLEHMRQRITRISPTNARRLDSSVAQLNGVIRQVRSFIPRMQTPAIQQGAFDQALLAIVQSLTVAGAGDIQLAIDKSVADGLSPTQCGPVLSIAKEALSNSLRHAGDAHRTVTVQLYRGKFRLEVVDDGKGFSPTARKSSGMGLANMRARARKLGARLTIRSRPKKGTQVVLDIPLPAPLATA